MIHLDLTASVVNSYCTTSTGNPVCSALSYHGDDLLGQAPLDQGREALIKTSFVNEAPGVDHMLWLQGGAVWHSQDPGLASTEPDPVRGLLAPYPGEPEGDGVHPPGRLRPQPGAAAGWAWEKSFTLLHNT